MINIRTMVVAVTMAMTMPVPVMSVQSSKHKPGPQSAKKNNKGMKERLKPQEDNVPLPWHPPGSFLSFADGHGSVAYFADLAFGGVFDEAGSGAEFSLTELCPLCCGGGGGKGSPLHTGILTSSREAHIVLCR